MYVAFSCNSRNTIVQSTIPPRGLRPSMSQCTIVKSELIDLADSDTLKRSTIIDSWIMGAHFVPGGSQTRIYRSEISLSQLDQVKLVRSTAQNAKMSRVHGQRNTIQGSEVDSSSLRRSLLQGSHVVGSWLSRSETQESGIENSRVRRSEIRSSGVVTSRLDRATVESCEVTNSVLLRGCYRNKTIHNEIWQDGKYVGSTSGMSEDVWMTEPGSESEEEGEPGDEMESSTMFFRRRNRECGRAEVPLMERGFREQYEERAMRALEETETVLEERELEREQAHCDDPPPPYSP